jgi:hypothetical protein
VNELLTWLSSNPTRFTGVTAYGATLACCVTAWARAKGDPARSRLAAILTFFEGCLLLDMIFNVRWILHQFFMDEAKMLAVYASRRGPQALALVVLVGTFFIALRVASQKFHGRGGALLAVSGALLSLVLWCTEVVSLHAVDHILYHTVGSVMTVTFLWIVACAMTSVGVFVESNTIGKSSLQPRSVVEGQ